MCKKKKETGNEWKMCALILELLRQQEFYEVNGFSVPMLTS